MKTGKTTVRSFTSIQMFHTHLLRTVIANFDVECNRRAKNTPAKPDTKNENYIYTDGLKLRMSRFFPIFARQLPPGECQGSHPVLALQRFLRVGLAAEFHVGRRSTAARRGKDGVEASSVRPGIYLYLGYWIL